MQRKGHQAKNPWRALAVLGGLLLMMITLTACGNQPQDLAQEVPVRRGGADTLGQVQEIISDITGVAIADVTEEADLRSDLDLSDDTLGELAAELSQAFAIDFTIADFDDVTTIQSLVERIEAKQ